MFSPLKFTYILFFAVEQYMILQFSIQGLHLNSKLLEFKNFQ